ncbi:hypothetical protein C1701_17165 [Actinoalloteichus sp. AHMU CJ021]|nr:hypothetical protein C1701_17165 [Actinoalloteichus sp. AHMU CJ021]
MTEAFETSQSERGLPFIVRPAGGPMTLADALEHRAALTRALHEHGVLVLRGFDAADVTAFEGFVSEFSGPPLGYTERSSPRSVVKDRVYTSTDYPASRKIYLHSEQSYNLRFPGRLHFFAVDAADTGGATTVADARGVLRRLDPRLVERFRQRGYMYVRNFYQDVGLTWQEGFQTDDRSVVDDYCARNGIETDWTTGSELRTRQVRSTVAVHPETGDEVWFNHATFFHVSTLPGGAGEYLLEEYGEQGLPNNTYYGDGSPIEASVLDELRGAYEAEEVNEAWRVGDLMVVDNLLACHGRQAYTGTRKIVVSMALPRSWDEVTPRG